MRVNAYFQISAHEQCENFAPPRRCHAAVCAIAALENRTANGVGSSILPELSVDIVAYARLLRVEHAAQSEPHADDCLIGAACSQELG